MEIQFEDGVADTAKMSDKEAELSEAIANLHKTCQKYNVTSFTRVILNEKQFLGQTTVVKGQESLIKRDFDFLMHTLNTFVEKITNGQVTMMRVPPPTPEKPA